MHLEGGFDRVELVGYRDRDRPTDTAAGVQASLGAALTGRQLSAVRMAYYGGSDEWPSNVSGVKVADAMDITRATFLQHLREAQRKLTEPVLESGRCAAVPTRGGLELPFAAGPFTQISFSGGTSGFKLGAGLT